MTSPQSNFNLSLHQHTLRQALQQRVGQDRHMPQIISRRTNDQPAPLSFAQEWMWLLEQVASPTYNNPLTLCWSGPLDRAILEQSLLEIMRRHEVLRSTIALIEGVPHQAITTSPNLPWQSIDLRETPTTEREAQALEIIIQETHRPFNLERDRPLRVTLLQLEDEHYWLHFTMHHIISDDTSYAILMQELATVYSAFCEGQPSPLLELPIQYADFACWQRQHLQEDALKPHLAYWMERLRDRPLQITLPGTSSNLPKTQVGAKATFTLSTELTQALKTLSRNTQTTLFTTLLTAFKILLYRYTAQADLLIGVPVSTRNQAELQNLIGVFINTLVIRSDLSHDLTYRELMAQIHQSVVEARSHQDLPYSQLVQALRSEHNDNTPLLQIIFDFQSTPLPEVSLPGAVLSFLDIGTQLLTADLTLQIADIGDQITGYFQYSPDRLEAAIAQRMVEHFQTVLNGIVTNPDLSIHELPLLTSTEMQQVLTEWNSVAIDDLEMRCIHEQFEDQVERSPNAVAIVFANQPITYQELNQRANQLAHYLKSLGIGPDRLVGICAERSIDMIVALLGTLKSGGAFVPIDPSYPSERISFMLEDAQVAVLLTQQRLAASLPHSDTHIVCLDDQTVAIDQPLHNPTSSVGANHLAYVIYTSGSTGRPKGVLIEQGAIARHCHAIIDDYNLTYGDRVLQFASFSFDAALEQILPTLLVGATLILRDSVLWTPSEFHQNLIDLRITVADLPPAFWHQWVQTVLQTAADQALPHLRLLICGGDRMLPDSLQLWRQTSFQAVRLLNAYGPTETTITATAFDLSETVDDGDAASSIPIGRPLAHRTVYILDRHHHPVPVGVPGELHIGGTCLARGYLNRPDLTAEKFIPDPFSDRPQARLYKTGDLARYRPDGCIEFLGRVDNQIKIRGFRIELGEIEAALSQHADVHQTVVIARDDQASNPQLIAYMVPANPAPTSDQLRQFLQQMLPDYMIPSAFVVLDSLPLTPNGKIDRRALLTLEAMPLHSSTTFVAPRNLVEEELAHIWSEVLQRESVGIYDNFFELGGHSLIATQITSRIRDEFHIHFQLNTLFEAPTIADLAPRITQEQLHVTDDQNINDLLAELENLSEEEAQQLLETL